MLFSSLPHHMPPELTFCKEYYSTLEEPCSLPWLFYTAVFWACYCRILYIFVSEAAIPSPCPQPCMHLLGVLCISAQLYMAVCKPLGSDLLPLMAPWCGRMESGLRFWEVWGHWLWNYLRILFKQDWVETTRPKCLEYPDWEMITIMYCLQERTVLNVHSLSDQSVLSLYVCSF